MYCYQNPATTAATTTLTTPPTTLITTAPPPCPSACTCLLPDEAKHLGYSLCGGKQSLCGYDKAKNPLYCYLKPATTTHTPIQSLVTITTTPTPFQYAKPLVPTTTQGEVYSSTLCPEHCSCVGNEMICYRPNLPETFDVTPTPLQYGKPELTTTPDEVYPQTLITCPENCICMAESSARAQGRSSCEVPVWAGGCEGLDCDWCGNQDNEDMYCFSNITREAGRGTSSQNELPPIIAPTREISSGKEPFTTTPPLVAPPDTRETAESPGGGVIPLGVQSVIGAITIAVIIIGLFSLKKT